MGGLQTQREIKTVRRWGGSKRGQVSHLAIQAKIGKIGMPEGGSFGDGGRKTQRI